MVQSPQTAPYSHTSLIYCYVARTRHMIGCLVLILLEHPTGNLLKVGFQHGRAGMLDNH